VANPKILKRGAEDNLSAPCSFISNAHNEIYAFYTGKSGFLTNMWGNRRGAAAPTAPSLWIRHCIHLTIRLPLAQIPLGSSRLDTFDVSSPRILAVSSLSNSTATHDTTSSTGLTSRTCRDVTSQV